MGRPIHQLQQVWLAILLITYPGKCATENNVSLRLTVLVVIFLIPTFLHDLDEGGKGDKIANGSKKPTGKEPTPVERRIEKGLYF